MWKEVQNGADSCWNMSIGLHFLEKCPLLIMRGILRQMQIFCEYFQNSHGFLLEGIQLINRGVFSKIFLTDSVKRRFYSAM